MSFDTLFQFEKDLAKHTGAPYAVVTDCCTHAIELCMRYDQVKSTEFTAYTYLSIPMLMHLLDIEYTLTDERWAGEYQFHNTRIWDSARRLEPGMYRSGQMQCLSFGNGKPLHLGRCGAILLDDVDAYKKLSMMRADGRDLSILPWQNHPPFSLGWHYCPALETCQLGINRLPITPPQCQTIDYPDCRKVDIR